MSYRSDTTRTFLHSQTTGLNTLANSIADWLSELGLSQYAAAFEENEINFDALSQLDHALLKELGVNKIGHRLSILNAISHPESPISDSRQKQPESPVDARTLLPDVQPDGERRQITVMFCDLVGSTEISSRLDPEDYREIVRAYQVAAEESIQRFDGHVAQLLGDGILAYFGYPTAHEDDAIRAAYAATEMLQGVARLAKGVTAQYAVDLDIRIGIHTGPVVVGDLGGESRTENLAIGETPNVAARLQALARPGSVVISSYTRRLIREVFELSSLGLQSVKGVPKDLVAYELGRERLAETRFAVTHGRDRTPMMGRKQELALVLDRWRQSEAGEGQVVILNGEAGIGKSRFVSVVVSELSNAGPIRISYQCSPYHTDTALFPALQHLAFAAKFSGSDSAEAKLEKLEALLLQGQDDIAQSVSLLGSFLGIGQVAESKYGVIDLPAQERREQSLLALIRQLVGLSRNRPVLFILEDAHWIDPSTLELVERSLEEVAQSRILILVTARPSFQHSFGGHPIVSRLTLNRLGKNEVVALVNGITHGKELPDRILEEIAAKTDGVPLYVEELTKSVIESNQLTETDGAYLAEQDVASITIPSSLHDSLIARLDRLESIKEVAHTAACIGREFSYALLSKTLLQSRDFIDRALEELAKAELVFRRGTPPNATYTFKHALVRDAAYESILKSRRLTIHGRIFDALREDDQASPELLAHHAVQAGRILEAIKYWEIAGDNSNMRAAFHEATGQYEKAIECFDALDSTEELAARELDVVVKLASASMTGFGYAHPTTARANAIARRALDDVKETPHRFPILYGSWVKNHVAGELNGSLVDGEEMVREAVRSGDRVQMLVAYRVRGASYAMSAQHANADADFSQALALYDESQDGNLVNSYANDPGIGARIYWAISLMCRGNASRAWNLTGRCEQQAYDAGHVNSYVYTLLHLAWLHDMAMTSDSNRLSRLLLDFATEHDLQMWQAYGHALCAASLTRRGEKHESAEEMSRAIELWQVTGTRLVAPGHLATHVLTLIDLGRTEEAQQLEALVNTYLADGVDLWAHAEIRRILSIAQFRRDSDHLTAIRRLKDAYELARSQGAALWTLRNAMAQAQVLANNAQSRDAMQILNNETRQFPEEGHQLTDYRQAKQMMESLRGN